MKTKTEFAKLVIATVIFLALAQLGISYFLASAGETVHRLEDKTAFLESENINLEKEIGKLGSLSRISTEANRLGFMQLEKTIALTSQPPVVLGSR